MINPKEWIFDRIEQSFNVVKNNFKNIFLSYFLYSFFIFLIWIIFYYSSIYFVNLLNIKETDIQNIWNIFNNTYFLIWINLFIIFIIIKLTLVIPFILATIKTIKDSFLEKENIDFVENIKYWFKNLYNSFKTYWYIFAYIALIPAFFIIIWWILLIIWDTQNLDNFSQIWLYILWFWFILLIIFWFYKWLKTSFSIYSAVDENKYTKENFEKSLKITENNWWRILWNFLLLSIFISIISWIINSILWIINIWSSNIFSNLDYHSLQNWKFSPEQINNIMDSLWSFSIIEFIINIIKLVFDNIFIIFSFVFTYIFYKRLELEKFWKIKEENIEIENNNNIEL